MAALILYTLVFVVHLLLALAYKEVIGVDIQANPNGLTHWDLFWQTVAVADLQADPLTHIWYLHTQPPLYNAFGAALANLFPAHFMDALHTTNILIGAALAGLGALLAWRTTGSRLVALLIGLLLAFNPALLLYEAYPLYTLLTAFWLVLAVWGVAITPSPPGPLSHKGRGGEPAPVSDGVSHRGEGLLYLFAFAMTAAVLTRSVYHPALLLVVIAVCVLLAGDRWRRVLLVTVLICLPGLGWATKNAVQFGFWGTSSWGGLNLWRAVTAAYPPDELTALAAAGVIDPLTAELDAFTPAVQYRPYGYDAFADNPLLDGDNLNNINIPAISATYASNALRLIAYDPARYIGQAWRAYNLYHCPAADFPHLGLNAQKMRGLVDFYGDGIYGRGVLPGWCSVHGILLPLALLAYAGAGLWTYRLRLVAWLRADPAMVIMAGLLVYTTLAGSLLEFPENTRFKFPIEPLLWVFVVTLVYRLLTRRMICEQPRARLPNAAL